MDKMFKQRTCCFFGHREISYTPELTCRLREMIVNLITEAKVDTFLFGSRSEFYTLCYGIVSELKRSYRHIRRIYVRAEFPIIDKEYTDYILTLYEHTYYPTKCINAGRAVYIERNREMINNSKYCIIYYDKRNAAKKSGTAQAYALAERGGLLINNVFDEVSSYN